MAEYPYARRRGAPKFIAAIAAFVVSGVAYLADTGTAQAAVSCGNTITANVVVLDNPTVFNRLGAQNPNWITYALKRDVIAVDPVTRLPTGDIPGTNLTPGNVELRPDKRPRPLVVRSIAGSCLEVTFTNLLAPVANPNDPQAAVDAGINCADNAAAPECILDNNDQVAGRCAGFHASGTEVVNSLADDGSMVGNNPGASIGPTDAGQANCGPGMVHPGGAPLTYTLHTPHEGAFVINSYGATLGSEASGGNLGIGMFGMLNVEPVGARMYRSIVTEEEMRLATVTNAAAPCPAGSTADPNGLCLTPLGQPVIDYEARYPNVTPWIEEGKANLPVLNMLNANELVHSDISAIIAGPNTDGSFPDSTYPLERETGGLNNVPSLPNRLEPFREFSSVYHDEQTNSQVFPLWYQNPVLQYTLAGVKDQFMINYGSGGIGSEIIANRLHTGPMHDCTDCAYEEFFLASQTVGDPGQLVNYPANTMIEACDPTNILDAACWRQFAIDADVNGDGAIDPGGELVGANPPIPNNFALFQEDPSNVHHSYTGDFVKIRNIHAGAFEQHIFHLHNHQWLFNPNDDNANYLDAQEIMPGSGHTYELVNGGAGNRNKTAGDAIFHCHFYPHFAQGMWYHLRIQDTFEKGSLLAVSTAAGDNAGNADLNGDGFHDTPFALRSGQPAVAARALPDGELPDGVPIPAVVPLPGKAMPHMPANVSVVAVDRGDFGVLSGRRPADGVLGQGPDSAQAVVKINCDIAVLGDCDDAVAGADGTLGTADDLNPGYPFWLAGNACGDDGTVCPQGTVGQRQPTPPLDMLTEAGADANGFELAQAGGWDGGLPRHNLRGYTSGGLSLDTQNRLDFRKVVEIAQPVYFPETGTDLEQVAMADHAVRERPSFANNLANNLTTAATLIKNGAPPVPGGPFQDPCIDDNGALLTAGVSGNWFDGEGGKTNSGTSSFDSTNPRTYRVANVQIDAVFNKVGWHYPQERIIALWDDVAPTIAKQRPPEPLVMRFNTFDCGRILHSNVVPEEFELDDFQVRTPTDIIGQHIHLPKWDLTTGDGAANGWNYEDGALSPGIVEERIHAINLFNDLALAQQQGADPASLLAFLDANGIQIQQDLRDVLGGHLIDLGGLAPVPTLTEEELGDPGSPSLVGRSAGEHLEAALHPFFDAEEYRGARTVIQRILVDPVHNVDGVDRGLGLTFSHDHYGPSTFQQIGLYSTILAEPAGSTWVHNESGDDLYGRQVATADCTVNCTDGGPTTWQAIIKTNGNPDVPEHREFYFEMSDFQHAYEAGVYVGADADGRPLRAPIVQPKFADVTTADAGVNALGFDLQQTWQDTINPPLKLKSVPFPDVVTAEGACPGPAGNADQAITRPCAEAINISHSSMFVVNYRNEPVGLRVFDPQRRGPDGVRGTQAAGEAGDLAFAFQTRTDRAIPQLNTSFGDMPYPTVGNCDGINCDRQAGDPITPIMRVYQRDNVKIKIQVGATEEQHQATVHGLKWLSNGSAFGRSGNSGWRNFQSHGISEQFSLQAPVNPDLGEAGRRAFDSLVATDATRDGIWTGSWGILRTYGIEQNDLVPLGNNPVQGRPNQNNVVNANEFVGVCPAANPQDPPGQRVAANLVIYDVTAVLANDVLPNVIDVDGTPGPDITIPDNRPVGGRNDNEGGPLDPDGGTLVYNRRGTGIQVCAVPVEEGEPCPADQVVLREGPLNDPTAIMYVRTDDLVPDPQNQGQANQCNNGGATNPACPVRLADNAPVEPLVLRANAGDCIEVTLRNRLPDVAPDLAGWQDMMWVVERNIQVDPLTGIPEMHFFNNNLIRPSSHVGLHPQLVEYDITRADGTLVGNNEVGNGQVAPPGGLTTYRWYAGDIEYVDNGNFEYEIVATPVEYGATNLLSADRIKQPQKGLFGSLVIEPAGACHPDSAPSETCTPPALEEVADGQGMGTATRLTRAQVTVTALEGEAGSGGTYREALAIGHKITNLRWADGSAITNVNQGELGREGAEDSGHAGFNYGMEPSWFRFQLPPDAPFGNAGTPDSYGSIPNAQAMYANLLVTDGTHPNFIPAIPGVSAEGDPQTPVFRATADPGGTNPVTDTRMYVLNGASADRDGTFILHGHVWQRDPYVCTGAALAATGTNAGVARDPEDTRVMLDGRCDPNAAVPSSALGLNAQAKYMGGEEGMGHVYGYWPILFDAGGSGAVKGDYLYRDYAPNGNRNGQFGILRVE